MKKMIERLRFWMEGQPTRYEKTVGVRRKVLERQLAWLKKHRKKITAVPFPGILYGDCGFDYDNLTHDQVIQVIKTWGGKWEKRPVEDRVDYRLDVDGFTVRCYRGEPPPNCKIVEVEEYVPPQPATTRTIRKLVCQEGAP